jgi:tryptophan-rich sensory protein
MFNRKKRLTASAITREIRDLYCIRRYILSAMLISIAIIFTTWIYFGGPCRVSMFFTMPYKGFTFAAYYIFWFFMFAAAGAEIVIIMNRTREQNKKITFLYHFTAHICMILWYPLFFNTFSQFLALIMIITAIVLMILYTKESRKCMYLLLLTGIVKIIILILFAYINISFLIIN